MSVSHKKSARLRDEERARLIWLLATDKAVTSALLGKLTLAERYDDGTLADDLAEVEVLVSHLPPPDLADALEALPYDGRNALWQLVSRSSGDANLAPRRQRVSSMFRPTAASSLSF